MISVFVFLKNPAGLTRQDFIGCGLIKKQS